MINQNQLPFFLSQSIHYSEKHRVIRYQDDCRVNLIQYDILRKDANREYLHKKYDRACRKYEEALGCFRYYESTSPSNLKNVEISGTSS